MKVAVVGSRTLNMDRNTFDRLLTDLLPHELGTIDTIVSGGARGCDRMAASYARRYGYALQEIRPQYKGHGRYAPLLRNEEIIEAADFVIAFWDGDSHGTRYTINRTLDRHKPLIIYYTNRGETRLFTPPRIKEET